MKKSIQTLSLLSAFMLSACSFIALALEDVDKVLDVDANSLIEIKHVSGDIKVLGWNKAQVQVTGELGDKTEEFVFERSGRSVTIEVKVERNRNGWGWGSDGGSGDDLVVYVPMQSQVDYHSPNANLVLEDVHGGSDIDMINGNLRATKLSNRIRLKTVNGDIRATELSGELSLDAVNGDIKADHIEGDEIRINTVNGDIVVNSKASEIKAETVNGDIEMTLADVSDLQSSTVNGSIEIDLNLVDGGRARASSVGGSIELGFQDSVQAKFSIEAHAGGSIKNRLTDKKASKAKYGPRKWLEFSTGDPTALVDLSTVHGRIEVKERN